MSTERKLVVGEMLMYLSAYKLAPPLPQDYMDLLEEGVNRFAEERPEEWAPFEKRVSALMETEEEVNAVPKKELVTKVRDYLHDELGYEWLTAETTFVYEYSLYDD